MTVPSLIQNYQRQSYVTQLHKVYNELMQASERYMTANNALNLREAGLTSQLALSDFFKTNFKIVNDCGTVSTPCLAPNSEYKKISGVAACGTGLTNFITLASGVSIGFSYYSEYPYVATLDIDINGQKGPNIAGRDFFVMRLYNNGLLDEGITTHQAPLTKEERENAFTSGCSSTNNDWTGCFGKLLNDNWQMTY